MIARGRLEAADQAGMPVGVAGTEASSVLVAFSITLVVVPASQRIGPLGSLGHPSTVLALVLFVWWCWHQLQRTHSLAAAHTSVRSAVLRLLVVVLAVYAHAMTLYLPAGERLNADSQTIRMLAYLGLVLVVVDGLTSWRHLERLIGVMVMLGTLMALLAIVQFFTRQLWIDRIPFPGMDVVESAHIASRGMFTRPSGTSTHPIEFGAVMSMLIPLALVRALSAKRHRLWLFAQAAVLCLAVLLSLSRSAILSVAVALLLLLPALSRRERLVLIGAGFFGGIGAGLAVPGLIGTLRGLFLGISGDSSVTSRTGSYVVAWEYFARHPILGRGLGTFLPSYWILDNLYLQLAIATGVIGLLAVLGLLVAGLGDSLRVSRHLDDPERARLARAVFCCIVAGALEMAFFDLFAFPQSMGVLFLLIGIAGAQRVLTRELSVSEDEVNG